MAGYIVDAVRRGQCPTGIAHKTIVDKLFCAMTAADKAGQGAVKNTAPEHIPDGIVKIGKSGELIAIALNRKAYAGLGNLGVHGPAFGIENHIGMLLLNGLHHFLNGVNIQKSGKVKTEAIDVVFIRPVIDGIHNVLAHHAPF